MTLSLSQSEGDPIVTSVVGDGGNSQSASLRGENQAREMVLVAYREFQEIDGTVQSEFQKFYGYNDEPDGCASCITNRTRTYYDTSNPVNFESYLIWYQSLCYSLKTPAQIVEDLFLYQAHVDYGTLRVPPNGTFDAGNWVAGPIGGPLHSSLQSDTAEVPNVNDTLQKFITVGGEPEACTISFTNLMPSNCASVKEIRIKAWFTQQTDFNIAADGSWGIDTELFHTAGATVIEGDIPDTSANAASLRPMCTSTPAIGPATLRFWEVRHTHLNLTKAQADDIRLVLTAQQKEGTSPATFRSWIYALELEFVYETTDIQLVDSASFDPLHIYFSLEYPIVPLLLTGSFVDVSIIEAVLSVIAHAQEMILFVANDGQVTVKKWPDFNSEAATSQLTFDELGGVQSVDELIYDRDKLTTTTEVQWATLADEQLVFITDNVGRTTTGVEKGINNRGAKLFIDRSSGFIDRSIKKEQALFRELYDQAREANVKVAFSGNQILYAQPIRNLELSVGHNVFVPVLGELTVFSEERLGLAPGTKWLCAAKTIDLDSMTGTVNLIDTSFAAFFFVTTLVEEPDPQDDSVITVNPNQAQYVAGSVVTLEAFPGSGKTFDHWEFDLTGSTNPDTITVDRDMFVKAVFV